LLGVVVLGACGFDHTVAPSHGTWLPGFAARKQIALAGGHAAIADFVALVAESADPDIAGSAEIAFAGEDGHTPLAMERVTYVPETGAFEAWIRISLVADRPTHVYLYYDGASTTPAPNEVWSPAIFAGAWHMTGARPDQSVAPDSVRGNDAIGVTGQNRGIPAVVDGIAGAARSYDGATDWMAVPDPTDGSLDFGTRSFGYSAWVDVAASAGDWDMPLFKGGSSSHRPGYDLELGRDTWEANLNDDRGANVIQAHLGDDAQLDGTWHQLVAVVDRGTNTMTSYVDGAQVAAVPESLASVDNPDDLYFGHDTDPFAGLLDEVRVYATAIDPDRIAAEYANLAHRDTFVTVGTAETR
jgi:hypothetical protein